MPPESWRHGQEIFLTPENRQIKKRELNGIVIKELEFVLNQYVKTHRKDDKGNEEWEKRSPNRDQEMKRAAGDVEGVIQKVINRVENDPQFLNLISQLGYDLVDLQKANKVMKYISAEVLDHMHRFSYFTPNQQNSDFAPEEVSREKELVGVFNGRVATIIEF